MKELIRQWKIEIEPLYDRYQGANISDRDILQEDIVSSVDSYFENVLEQMNLKRYLGDVPNMNAKQAYQWMNTFYLDELKNQIGKYNKVSGKISFSEHFLRLYFYKQRVNVIDEMMCEYSSTGKKNQMMKSRIWSETYELYDSIRYFEKLRGYRNYHFRGYKDADEWMREQFTDCILECMNKYMPGRKKSFVGYTIDIFQNYRIKDALKRYVEQTGNITGKDVSNESDSINISSGKKKRHGYEDNSMEKELYENGEFVSIIFNEYMEKVMNLIIQLYGKMDNSVNNTISKAEYFRLIFSENVIQSLKICEGKIHPDNLANEKDIFSTMNLSWVDYLMSELCRTYGVLMETPLKNYGDILHNGKEEEIVLPANTEIYTTFINEIMKISRDRNSVAVSLSKYRAKYREQMRMVRG